MMLCSEIMKRQVISTTLDTTAAGAALLMKEQQIGFLPVCDASGRAIGVMTVRDIALRVCAEDRNSSRTALAEIMTRKPICCKAASSVAQAEALMLKHKTRRILCVDAHDRVVGLVTLADVVHHQDPIRLAHFVRELTDRRFRMER